MINEFMNPITISYFLLMCLTTNLHYDDDVLMINDQFEKFSAIQY